MISAVDANNSTCGKGGLVKARLKICPAMLNKTQLSNAWDVTVSFCPLFVRQTPYPGLIYVLSTTYCNHKNCYSRQGHLNQLQQLLT